MVVKLLRPFSVPSLWRWTESASTAKPRKPPPSQVQHAGHATNMQNGPIETTDQWNKEMLRTCCCCCCCCCNCHNHNGKKKEKKLTKTKDHEPRNYSSKPGARSRVTSNTLKIIYKLHITYKSTNHMQYI